MLDGVEFGKEVVDLVRGYCEREIAPLRAENAELKERLKAIEDRPAPEVVKGDPGESVDLAEINVMVDAAVAKAVAGLPKAQDGKDGASIVAPVKDNGELCFTLDNGQLLRTGIRDGEKGADGKDGFNLDDYDEWFEDDGRTLVRRFVIGEDYKEFRHQTVLPRYRQYFKEGVAYKRGDVVTFGGAAWHCEVDDTPQKPDAGDGWVKMVYKGRDGKDARG